MLQKIRSVGKKCRRPGRPQPLSPDLMFHLWPQGPGPWKGNRSLRLGIHFGGQRTRRFFSSRPADSDRPLSECTSVWTPETGTRCLFRKAEVHLEAFTEADPRVGRGWMPPRKRGEQEMASRPFSLALFSFC